ncbi:GNAT family N-acetyltransferase [Enterococcus sp. LJL98]
MLTFKWRQEVLKEDWPFLLTADPSRASIEAYLFQSVLLEVREEKELVGLLVLKTLSDKKAEIMNVSVHSQKQNHGIGSRLLQKVIFDMKNFAYEQLLVQTGTTSFGPLYFYQKNGFRVTAVVPDYFTQHYADELRENGLVLQDGLVLTRNL